MADMEETPKTGGKHQKVKLNEINSYLTCQICKGYLIDATTISECLHSFCRSCIIKFLQDKSHCPVCEVIINKAKPNLKLDKALQDIVYKLVPELFLKEMHRRQTFYAEHPDLAARVNPEQRGEDTERTIFNPRDSFSLCIEYTSDDSTPGAILVPADIRITAEAKNNLQKEAESPMRRFLQCPGMFRVDILKKWVHNKYNVDTKKFHIDILYKKVPLPDHYTLIDIAYIYSWKRNEPMKFFFRITDINLAKDRFDYLEPASERQPTPTPTPPPKEEIKPSQKPESKKESDKIVVETEKIKEPLKNGNKIKTPVFTNITLNRSNNVEIITKIQKVSNKNGQPIGLNIIKQTVKKPKAPSSAKKQSKCDNKTSNNKKQEVKSEPPKVTAVEPSPPKTITPLPPSPTPTAATTPSEPQKEPVKTTMELDDEKERFLKSIELTSRSVLQTIAQTQKSEPAPHLKRKLSSSPRGGSDKPKKPKVERKTPAKKTKAASSPKSEKKPAQSTTASATTTATVPSENLKSLLNTCKIPSSLSITCVNGDKEMQVKPNVNVVNHIEILKLPDPKMEIDEDKQKLELEKVGTTMQPAKMDEVKKEPDTKSSELSITITIENPNDKALDSKPIGVHPNLPMILPPTGSSHSTTPRGLPTFQKMFEDTIKKPEFAQKIQKCPNKNKKGSPSESTNTNNKRNILEIASKLIKKTKLEQEQKDANANDSSKAIIPILNTQKTLMKPKKSPEAPKHEPAHTLNNLHSTSLGLNYSISVSQLSDDVKKLSSPTNVPKVPSPRPAISPNIKVPLSIQSPKYPLPYTPQPAHKSSFPTSSSSPVLPGALLKPTITTSPKSQLPSPKLPHLPSPKLPSPRIPCPKIHSPRTSSPKLHSPRTSSSSSSPRLHSPKVHSPKLHSSPKVSSLRPSTASPDSKLQSEKKPPPPALDPNQLQEKYNLQNLAQLTANLNFNMAHQNNMAFQQAMILNQLELHNRHQNLFSMGLQYEKYLASLNAANGQNKLLNNIKEN